MIKKFLHDIGLSEKEISIYLELLSVDYSSILNLSIKTGILRTSIYNIADSLIEKELISEIEVGKKIYFQAEPPERIAVYIQSQKLKAEEHLQIANDFIPQLKSLSREAGEKPIVKIYEGREGVFKANEESFGYGRTIQFDTAYFIYPYDLIENLFTEQEIKKSSIQRINRHIKSKAIYTYTKGERSKSEDSVRVKIDDKKYPLKCDISIFKDMIRIHTLGKSLSSLVIKSKDIAETLKSIFEVAFDNQQKIDK